MSRLRRSCRKKLQRNYVYRYGQTIGRLQRELFHLLALLQVISLALNMTYFFYCLCERSEANSREGGGLRSICSVLFQGDCRGRFAPSQ